MASDDLTRMLRSAQRVLAKTDVFTYGEYVFGYEPAPHHRQMVEFALGCIERGESGVILAPRGAAKSTWLNTIMISWLIARMPDIRVGLFSQKDKKAEDMSGAIMNALAESEDFAAIFGNLRGPKWTAGGWLRKDSPWANSKDRTMVSGGSGSSSAVSKRFSLIICHEKGTLVFADGEWMPVENHPTASVAIRDGIEVAVWGLPFPEVVTGEHRFWTIGIPDEQAVTPARRVGFGRQGWTEARDLTSEHAIGWPIDLTVESVPLIPWHTSHVTHRAGHRGAFGNEWTMDLTYRPEFEDPDWWWMLGLWWGDGHLTKRQVGFTVSSDEVHAKLVRTLERHGLKWYRFEREGCWNIVSPSTRWSAWLRTWRSGLSRKQPPAWVERLDPMLQAHLLRGYLDADGYYRDENAEIKLTSIHLPGLLSVRRMLARLGVPASIRKGPGPRDEKFRGGISRSQQKYDLRFHTRFANRLGYPPRAPSYRPEGTRRTFIKDGFLWSKIRSISEVEDREFVPIQTESHEYLTHFGRSHNCDDILDENNTYTIDQREKVETWFWKTLYPTLVPGGSLIYVGTKWTDGDLPQQLIEVNKWPSLVIPAIYDVDTPQERSYWPQEWPLSRLYSTRETVGWDNFACSYMNTVEDKRGAIFHADWWRETYFDALPRDRTFTFTIGIDLATSVKERADYTAGCVVARDDRNEWWVLHHARIKTDDGHRQFVQGLWDWCAEQGYPVSRIIMESNQAQEAIVTAIQRQTPLPVIGRRTDVDKRAKARGAATFYESHRVHHHTSLKGRELESELRSFDKGHDDLVDALCLAMDITGHSGTTLGVSPPPDRNLSPTGPVLRGPETVPFRDGARQVPPHVVDMLRGIPTETLLYTEAMAAMNNAMLSRHLKSILPGIRR